LPLLGTMMARNAARVSLAPRRHRGCDGVYVDGSVKLDKLADCNCVLAALAA